MGTDQPQLAGIAALSCPLVGHHLADVLVIQAMEAKAPEALIP